MLSCGGRLPPWSANPGRLLGSGKPDFASGFPKLGRLVSRNGPPQRLTAGAGTWADPARQLSRGGTTQRVNLSPYEVAELIAQYRAHHVSRRDPRRCSACPERYQCWYRIAARDQLLAARVDLALWR